jgi:hypothetical protein
MPPRFGFLATSQVNVLHPASLPRGAIAWAARLG